MNALKPLGVEARFEIFLGGNIADPAIATISVTGSQ
jgi:hypothetical protein